MPRNHLYDTLLPCHDQSHRRMRGRWVNVPARIKLACPTFTHGLVQADGFTVAGKHEANVGFFAGDRAAGVALGVPACELVVLEYGPPVEPAKDTRYALVIR